MSSSSSLFLQAKEAEAAAFRAKNFAELARALIGEASSVEDPSEAMGTWYRAGAAAEKAGDYAQAIECFSKVREHPVWEPLSRLHRLEIHWRQGEWPSYLAVLEEELASGALWKETDLRLEKARVLAFRLGRMEEAAAELEKVRLAEPDCREAAWLLLAIHLRGGEWDKVVEDYTRLYEKAAADPDPAFQDSCAYRLGQILEFRYRQTDTAGDWYGKVDDDREPLLARLARMELREAEKDFPHAANELSAILKALGGGPEEAAFPFLKFELSRWYADGMADTEAAARELEELLERFPDNFSGLYEAVELAQERGPAERRAELCGRLAKLVEEPAERALLLADRTRVLLEELDQPEPAVNSAREWLTAAPEDVAGERWLIEALIRAGKYGEAVSEIDRALSHLNDPREKQALLFMKAEVASYKLGDTALALSALRSSLEIPPTQFPVLKSMARLYHLNRDYENLARLLTAAMKLVQEPAVRNYYQSWLAALYLERLGRPDQAFALCGELIKSDPRHRGALKTIARISRNKAGWSNLLGALDRLAKSTRDAVLTAELKCRMAWLWEVRLNQEDKALALYQETLPHPLAQEGRRRILYRRFDLSGYVESLAALADSGSPTPFQGARLTRLAGAREIRGELAEAWAAYEKARVSLINRPHLFLPMLDLAQVAGYWGRYLRLLEDFAPHVSDPMKRALLWESAWCRAEMPGNSGRIDAEAMQRAMRNLDEMSGGWSAALRGSFLAAVWTGDHRARAELLARMMKQVPEEAAEPLRLRLAVVLRDDLGAREESIAAFRQVLARDTKSLPLLRELELMYEEDGQWGELIRMLLMEIPLRKDPELLTDLYSRLARLYEEKFQAADEAIKCHTAILRLTPGRVESHRERVRLLESRGRWEDLDKALAEYETVVSEPEEKVRIMVQAAGVCDEKMRNPDRAIAYLKKALEVLPSRQDVLDILSAIHEREQRWPELVDVLLAQVGRTPLPADQAVLYEKMAEIEETKIGDQAAAIQHLVIARDLAPERTSVLFTLERLFTAASRWEDLVDTLERLAKTTDRQTRIAYFSRIGALWDEKLGRLDAAVAGWERVRELDGQNLPALAALVSLYERTANHPAFVERAVALAELKVEDKTAAVDLLCRAAAVLSTRLGDDERALALYHRAMAVDHYSLVPLAPARALYEKREAWPEVIALWSHEEEISDAIARKLEIFVTIGEIYERRIADERSAESAYEKALALDGEYLPAVIPLSELYFKRGAFGEARPLYELRTQELSSAGAEVRAEVWDKAGWCAEQTGDVAAAMSRYHRSVESVAEYRHPLERLSELYAQQEKWEEAAEFTSRLLAVVEKAQDTAAAFVFLQRLGLVEDRRNRLEAAVQAYERALQLQPGNYEVLGRLVDLYSRLQDWKKALYAYDLLIKNSPTPEAAAAGLVGKGVVLEDKLREEESALAHFRKAAELAPANLTAWERLSAIYLRRSAWPEAEIALHRLLQLETDKARLVEHHYHLGHVLFRGKDEPTKAREQFEAALSLDPVHVPSMQALGEIYLKLEEWEKFVATTEKFVKIVPLEKQPSLPPIYLQLGRVYRDHLKNTERAVINFQAAIKLDTENKEARRELAALYLSDPKFIDQAKAENRNLLRLEPLRFQTYRDLADIYKSQKNLDAQFFLYSFLHLFDALDVEEQMFYEANLSRVPKAGRRTLKDVEREGQLIHPEERGPLRDMLLAMADTLDKVFPMPLDKYGAKKSYLLTEKSVSPLKDLAVEVALPLGADIDVYQVPTMIEPQVMATPVPALVANAEWFNRFTPREQRFLMGRLIEHLVDRHAFVFHYPAEQVFRILCLLAMSTGACPNFNLPGLPPDEAEKQKKNLRKLIPRKYKTQIEQAAERFTPELAELDPRRWKKAMEHTANRAGLLICGDFNSAVSAILKTDPQYQNLHSFEPKDLMPLWEKHPDIIELLTFAVSDQFFRLRFQTGLALA